MSAYYSTLKRGLKWFRKVGMEYLFGMALVNAWIIYNMKNEKKVSKKEFTEALIQSITGKNICPDRNQVTPTADHILEMSSKRRNCVGCYEKLREIMKSSEVKRKVKKIKTYCRMCKQNLCAKCFKDSH
ncbi:uncharacterized protein LOC114241357 [Bombyx mandarina]|uniref:Uncharacterized protein LOC114241357 n=1 Tax=Bombyx mandarina TaxID=7092 RepID=A0A6J2JFZ9_BOMMA|nr:uncharacterized protein LOC114241357 [Bombyx mandarina]